MKMSKKGTSEGVVGTLIAVIIAMAVLYVLWRMYGGGGSEPKTTASIIASILGR